MGPRFAVAFAALCFLLMGLLFLPRLGFEYDEVMFVTMIFHPSKSAFAARIAHRFIPADGDELYRERSRLGCTAPLFKFWRPGLYSVRLPMLVLASFTVLLVGETVRRRASSRAAIFTGALLATRH